MFRLGLKILVCGGRVFLRGKYFIFVMLGFDCVLYLRGLYELR